jgi:hypothetical protein
VYIWDLRDLRPVFRSRSAGEDTVIIPVRIAGIPGGNAPAVPSGARFNLSQHDCAVANDARQQLGVQVMTMHNAPTPEPIAANAPGDASAATDAAPTAADAGARP